MLESAQKLNPERYSAPHESENHNVALTLDQANESMPFAKQIGVVFTQVDPDVVKAHLDWAPELCTVGEAMHGGALMTLADAAGAMAAFVNLPEGASGTTTVTSASNFVRAVRDGRANAVSKVLHKGRSTIVVETSITNGEGRTVAKVTQTQAVLS